MVKFYVVNIAKSLGLLFLLLLFFPAARAAQEVCELKSKTAPLLLNLTIGASPEQARANFGKDLKIKIKKSGERTFFQNYIKKPAPERLGGVRALYLRFYDRKLYQIEIFYEPRADLPNLETIVNALSAQLNFPVAVWRIENNRAEIKCGEVSLIADNVLNPRVELTDETVRAAIAESRKRDGK